MLFTKLQWRFLCRLIWKRFMKLLREVAFFGHVRYWPLKNSHLCRRFYSISWFFFISKMSTKKRSSFLNSLSQMLKEATYFVLLSNFNITTNGLQAGAPEGASQYSFEKCFTKETESNFETYSWKDQRIFSILHKKLFHQQAKIFYFIHNSYFYWKFLEINFNDL